MLESPCKNCPDRNPHCHSTCEKYIAFANERKEYLSAVYKARQDEQATFDEKRHLAAQKQKWRHGNKRKLY